MDTSYFIAALRGYPPHAELVAISMRQHGLRMWRLAVAALLLRLAVSAGAECRFRLV